MAANELPSQSVENVWRRLVESLAMHSGMLPGSAVCRSERRTSAFLRTGQQSCREVSEEYMNPVWESTGS